MISRRFTSTSMRKACCGLAAAAAVVFSAAGQRGLPAREGILNLGKLNDSLYRGAQPDATGITNLARLGVKTIVNLRLAREVWKPEQVYARSLGILYTNIPMAGVGRPSAEQMRRALSIIESSPGPVFVHCQHGCDRTGAVIACYRIKHDQWSAENALLEAARYGMSPLERGMKKYVVEFGRASKTAR